MSLKGRISSLEKKVKLDNNKVLKFPEITKEELLAFDYQEYREAHTIFRMCFWFFEGTEEAKKWAKEMIKMEASLIPKTRPAEFSSKAAAIKWNKVIGEVWDKYPYIEEQCFKYINPIRDDKDYDDWFKPIYEEAVKELREEKE